MFKYTLERAAITQILHGADALSDARDKAGESSPELGPAIAQAFGELAHVSPTPSVGRRQSLIAIGMMLAVAALDATADGWTDASTDGEALLLAYNVTSDMLAATDEEPLTLARTLGRAPCEAAELFARAAGLIALIALAAEKTS